MSDASRAGIDRDLARRLDEVERLPLAAHPDALEDVVTRLDAELDALRRPLPRAADPDLPERGR